MEKQTFYQYVMFLLCTYVHQKHYLQQEPLQYMSQ